MIWAPIDTAPKKSKRPVWVRGWNWGRFEERHYCWAYWDEGCWKAAGPDGSILKYLDEWLPETIDAALPQQGG